VTRLYAIRTARFGTILVERDSIEEARQWARDNFDAGSSDVSAHRTYRRCDDCNSAPCCCRKDGGT
jgi:hypothetical protein